MSTATEEIAGQIDERVEKIQAEIRKLEEARAALTSIVAERKTARPRTRDHEATRKPDPRMARPGTAPHTLPRSTIERTVDQRKYLEEIGESRRKKLKERDARGGSVPTRSSKRRRARRGSRPRQVLDLIEAKPGISTGGIVKAIAGVNGPHVYQVVRKLADAGEIAGSHKGWSREGLTAE